MGNRFVMVKPAAAAPKVQYKAFVKTRGSYEPIVTGEAVYSWGRIGQGELTMWAKPRFYYQTPLEMLDIPVEQVQSIAAGYDHGLLATKNGQIYAFGDNKFGCLGYTMEETDYVDHFPVPRLVPGTDFPSRVVSVHASNNVSAALCEDGSLYTWGFPGSYFGGMGALGRRTSKKDYHIPKRVMVTSPSSSEEEAAIVRFGQVSLGKQNMFAVSREGGRLYKWGKFNKRRMADCLLPVQVMDLSFPVKQVASNGEDNVLLLDEQGFVHRQSHENGAAWERVEELKDIAQIACGQTPGHRLALDAYGQVFASSKTGEEFKLVGGEILGKRITHIAAGNNFAACISSEGRVYAWGDFNAHKAGALGSGNAHERRVFFEQNLPKPVFALDKFACQQLVCGRTFCLALGIKAE